MFCFFKKISKVRELSLERRNGFTILELLVVIAIFFIITTIVISDIPNFSSKSSLDLTASEVATYIRGAQVYGSSQKGGDYINPDAGVVVYGIHLQVDQNSFYLFKDNKNSTPHEETYSLKGFKISQIKVFSPAPITMSSLDIIFKANDFTSSVGSQLEPLIYEDYGGGSSIPNFLSAEIKIVPEKGGSDQRCVRVYGNGQITIETCS